MNLFEVINFEKRRFIFNFVLLAPWCNAKGMALPLATSRITGTLDKVKYKFLLFLKFFALWCNWQHTALWMLDLRFESLQGS